VAKNVLSELESLWSINIKIRRNVIWIM
jgi:hypothetical protein